jgi:hypothetical protein
MQVGLALVGDDHPVAEVDHALGVLRDLGLVRDQRDRPARAVQTVKHAHDVRRGPRVEFPVGSSAKISAGLVTTARATAVRCRSPPESSDG